MQNRIHNQNWTSYNEANDYSYDGTKTAFADWNRVTLYRNGALVWGTEPTVTAPDTQAPTAPAALVSTGQTSTTIALSWTGSTDNVGVTGYRVREGTTVVGTPTGTTFTVTGLAPSTAHTYTVVAFDAAGNVSAASNAVTASTTAATDTQPPTAPTGLVVDRADDHDHRALLDRARPTTWASPAIACARAPPSSARPPAPRSP